MSGTTYTVSISVTWSRLSSKFTTVAKARTSASDSMVNGTRTVVPGAAAEASRRNHTSAASSPWLDREAMASRQEAQTLVTWDRMSYLLVTALRPRACGESITPMQLGRQRVLETSDPRYCSRIPMFSGGSCRRGDSREGADVKG